MNYLTYYFSLKYKGDWSKIYLALINHEDQNEYLFLENEDYKKIKAIDLTDEKYPNKYKKINQPPFILYYSRTVEWLDKKNIWLIDYENAISNYDILTLIKAGYGFVIYYDNVVLDTLINRLISLKARICIITDEGIYSSKNIKYLNHSNVSVISEIPKDYDSDQITQDLKRLACASSDHILCVNELYQIDDYLFNKYKDCQLDLVLLDKKLAKQNTIYPKYINRIYQFIKNSKLIN
ncbi:hypothetical protein [Ureaplasma parvum]|uniref:hypothetical protein n=1 Tax=Ureaplasma parvum TaxID=134821 RepID=UPI0029621891|nr:hypothetical protein [Ureaplasma parvum]